MENNGRRGNGRLLSQGDAEALEGFTDMGMRDLALALAGEILKKHRPHPKEITEAIRAIGVHAYRMKAWNSRVARMADRLPKRSKHAVREDLLTFFALNSDYKRAVSFIYAPRTFSTHSLFLAFDTYLNLRRFSEATSFARKYMRDFSNGDCDAFECEASAVAMGIEGDHLGALLHRINAPVEPAMEATLIHGIVESTCALVVRHIAARIEKLRRLRKEGVMDPLQLTIPGINDALQDESEGLCRKIQTKFTRLIPKDRQFLYKLDPIEPGDDGEGEETFSS